jgi:uroporphyrinogen III methyltransferase/synthase
MFAAARRPDCITFTSSSTVQNFVAMARAETLADVTMASIGPITSQTARSLGVRIAVEANPFTVDGLVDAILQLFGRLPTSQMLDS